MPPTRLLFSAEMNTDACPKNDESWRRFRAASEELRLILNRQGAKLESAGDRHRAHFLGLELSRQNRILQQVDGEIAIYSAAEAEGIVVKDSLRHLQFALRYLGMGVDSSFFSMVKSDDIIELYSLDHIQLFRSFNFFSLCNYTLDDLMIFEWFNLYERAEEITRSMLCQLEQHLSGTASISRLAVDTHVMREKFAKPRGHFRMRFGYIASSFAGPGKRVGYVVNLSAQAIEAN